GRAGGRAAARGPAGRSADAHGLRSVDAGRAGPARRVRKAGGGRPPAGDRAPPLFRLREAQPVGAAQRAGRGAVKAAAIRLWLSNTSVRGSGSPWWTRAQTSWRMRE